MCSKRELGDDGDGPCARTRGDRPRGVRLSTKSKHISGMAMGGDRAFAGGSRTGYRVDRKSMGLAL